jgi:dihydrofolate reductase
MRADNGKDIWLFGGGALFGSLASAGLVDTVESGVMPVMLGGGRPVISGNTARVKLRLAGCESSPGGAISVKYDVDARA